MKKIKPPILRPEEEEEIVKDVIDKVKKGERVRRQDVISKVVKFIRSDRRKNPFRNGSPGDKWFSLFRRRHNDDFLKLEPDMLKAVEQLGFTEKVTNTVTYPRSPVNSSRKEPMTPRLRKPLGRPRTLITPTDVTAEGSKTDMAVSSPPVSEESCNTTATDDDTNKSQESQSDANDFRPGSKLEVMDFNEKWYPVKVVEVDYEEGEVLVHFEKWSDRYDEWVRMDSNRIRRPLLTQGSSSKKVFVENEKVIAVWAYNHKYPATVKEVLPNDKYEVLFCDGYAKVLRGCKLFKATEEDLKNVQLPPPKKPAPPMGADPIDPDLGPKEERRLKKRRLDVLEAYRPHKRQRLDMQQSTPEISPQPSTSTYKLKETPKVILRMRGRPPKKHKQRVQDDEDDDDYDKWLDEGDEEQEQSEPELIKLKRRKKKKKLFDESNYTYRGSKHRAGLEENSERWNTEIPEGVSPVQIKDQEGYYRESIIIPDKKIPPGWTKHTMRRKSGAKWDVFLVNPVGRKFRSRNELRNYFAELKQPFPDECFDFMVGRKMEMIKNQAETRKKLYPGSPLNKSSPLYKRSPIHKRISVHKKSDREESKKAARETTPDLRRIKTLLPKSRQQDSAEDDKGDQSPGASPGPFPLSSPPFPLSELRTPDGGFTCCGKTFRKENLFQMHMKHYHPEYSNLFGSTPNVADLAYARTVGEPLEDSRAEAMTPKNSFIERVNKYEAERKALTDLVATPDISGAKNIPEKEAVPVDQPPGEPVLPVVGNMEDHSSPVVKENIKDNDGSEKPKEDEKIVKEVTEKNIDSVTKNSAAPTPLPPSPAPEEKKTETLVEKIEMSTQPAATVEPTQQEQSLPSSSPPANLPSLPTTPLTSSIPVIKPVSKATPGSSKTVTSEAVIVQTTSSSKTPITITKYIPPGQKPTLSTTKMTISVTSPAEKEIKPTIKTLLPMRPPTVEPKDVQEIQKPKEIKSKEDAEEDTPNKSRPRKRTVSESLPKKPKLMKPLTGSLEEEPVATLEVPPPPSATNTSYRFSRNRSLPRVSLEKLSVIPDSNGRVVFSTPEDKISNTAGVNNVHSSDPLKPSPAADIVYENLRKEEIINCTCGYMEEDGLMIQCDLCLCWQHGLCNNIDKEADVPEKYVCYICQNPARHRTSTRHVHSQDWLKEGKLPSLSFRPKNEENVAQRNSMLKKSHDLVGSLLQLKTVIRSLRVKTHIATKPDHPKLYLWAKSWKNENSEVKSGSEDTMKQEGVSGPQPEAAIDETECRLRLLEHVEDYQHQVDDRLTSIQAQIAALESEDPDLASDEATDHYPVTKQTVQMILRDLHTVRKVAALN